MAGKNIFWTPAEFGKLSLKSRRSPAEIFGDDTKQNNSPNNWVLKPYN